MKCSVSRVLSLFFGGSLVRKVRFGDLTRDFWRNSCAERLLVLEIAT